MKKIKLLLSAVIFTASVGYAQTFTLKSNEVGGQASAAQVFNGMGCTGKNISPQLSWENAPAGTKSFAITMHDPDAPTGSGWWHWVLFDLPASTKELKSGAGDVAKKLTPAGSIQSITDFGQYGYGGPCPPEGHGFHRYVVTVHALNTDKLGLDKDTNPATVGFYLHGATIEKASIVFYYKR
jgi:Raf kinase inhibitor-like YbhB/YbcL family protein